MKQYLHRQGRKVTNLLKGREQIDELWDRMASHWAIRAERLAKQKARTEPAIGPTKLSVEPPKAKTKLKPYHLQTK